MVDRQYQEATENIKVQLHLLIFLIYNQHMLKVNNKDHYNDVNWRCSGVFLVNYEDIYYNIQNIILKILFITLSMYLSAFYSRYRKN